MRLHELEHAWARALGQAALRVRNLLRNRAARPVHVYVIHNNMLNLNVKAA